MSVAQQLDQAARLRRLMEGHAGAVNTADVMSFGPGDASHDEPPRASGVRLARAVAITSGKGGVGKTNIAVNVSVALSQMGLKVCLLDADLGLANADLLCNLAPRRTLEHVVNGECSLVDAAVVAPGGFRLLPGASGVSRLADLDERRRSELLRQLAAIDHMADVIVIDTGAGISENVLAFTAAAHRVFVVTTPEPTAMTDAYGLVKAMNAYAPWASLDVLVNMAIDDIEAVEVHRRLDLVTNRFLGRSLGYAGAVPVDRCVAEAVRARIPFYLYDPQSPCTEAVRRVAQHLRGVGDLPTREEGFFTRLARRFRRTSDR